jgi:hypothetical protein
MAWCLAFNRQLTIGNRQSPVGIRKGNMSWSAVDTIAVCRLPRCRSNQTFNNRYSRSNGLITSMKVSNSAFLIAA